MHVSIVQTVRLFTRVQLLPSVGEVAAVPSDKISKQLNNRKPYQCVLLVLFLPLWYQGVITIGEVLMKLTL